MLFSRDFYHIGICIAVWALVIELKRFNTVLREGRGGKEEFEETAKEFEEKAKEFEETARNGMEKGEKLAFEERLAALEANQKMVLKTQDRILDVLESRSTRWNQGPSE